MRVCVGVRRRRAGLLSALAGLAVTLGAATAEEADVEKAAKAALRRWQSNARLGCSFTTTSPRQKP